MKYPGRTLLFFIGIIALGIMQSCSDDNEDPNPTPSGPQTLTFSHIDHTEFKMWTNGGEVNTDNLSIENYMDSADYEMTTPEYFSSHAGFTFENDSIFSESDGLISGYPYHISNDSIFVTIATQYPDTLLTINQFIAMGNTTSLYIPQKFFKIIINSGMFGYESSEWGIGHYTFDGVADSTGVFETEDDIQEQDTLIIYNQRAVYN